MIIISLHNIIQIYLVGQKSEKALWHSRFKDHYVYRAREKLEPRPSLTHSWVLSTDKDGLWKLLFRE